MERMTAAAIDDYVTKRMDGRIDNPNAGRKGRMLWTTYAIGDDVPYRDREGYLPKVVRFQLRPDPPANLKDEIPFLASEPPAT
jgi:hypothetical protein